jgi:hypothetical protein
MGQLIALPLSNVNSSIYLEGKTCFVKLLVFVSFPVGILSGSKEIKSPAPVAHICNPGYSRGRAQEDPSEAQWGKCFPRHC